MGKTFNKAKIELDILIPTQPFQEKEPAEEVLIKESVFSYVLNRDGKTPMEAGYAGVDLQKKRDDVVERTIKESVMSAREVLLEQNRARDILQKKFKSLENPQVLQEYSEKLRLSPGVREDLKNAIPVITQALESLKFQSELAFEDREEYLYAYIGGNIRLPLRAILYEEGLEQLTSDILENEIDSTLKILSDARERPVLAHRVRGFGKSESSKEALATALKMNVAEIEFDIRASSDKSAMVHHPATLGTLAGRPEAVHDLTETQLKEVTLKSGEHLTSLRDLFENVKEQKNEVTKLNIDIKDFDEKMLDQIHDLIKEYGFEHRVAIVSWFPQALQYLYEKDPTLSYSLSYYPKIRGLSRWLIEKVERVPQGKRLFGHIGTWFAKQRAEAMAAGTHKAQGTLAEIISETIVISAETHWRNLGKEEGVGKYPFGYAETNEIDGEKEAAIMARVLHNGSVNIAAVEETFAPLLSKMHIPEGARDYILNLLARLTSVRELASDLGRNGIKLNLFDLKSKKTLETHFESLEASGVKPGVVYSSNPDLVTRLSTVEPSRIKSINGENINNSEKKAA